MILRTYSDDTSRGLQQVYQTHNEVARLIRDLLAARKRLNIYSFVTADRREERPVDGLRIISLGAKDYAGTSLLQAAVEEDDADAIVAHFPNMELLHAVAAKKSRAAAVLATSYNRKGIRSFIEKRKVVSLLNNPRFELVSNHCLPATRQLAQLGVHPHKLIAWDIPHPFVPSSRESKQLTSRSSFRAVYVGSIAESKGVADLIRAVARVRELGLEVHCLLAGLGDLERMRTLGRKLGITDLLNFVGLIGNTEVFSEMVAADLVIVPSRTEYPEGFPLTMFEAIASRTPIVCSDHPMFRPVIQDSVNATVFPAGNFHALASAIHRTLTNSALYAQLSANAILTWEALSGPADWRTMIVRWVAEGTASPWIRRTPAQDR